MKKEETLKIQDIFDGSDKAELLEKLNNLLSQKGSKCIVIGGVPDGNDIAIAIYQIGFNYLYEILGFLNTAYDIAQECMGNGDGI